MLLRHDILILRPIIKTRWYQKMHFYVNNQLRFISIISKTDHNHFLDKKLIFVKQENASINMYFPF